MKLEEQDFVDAAAMLDCEPAAIKAVCEVEAPRGGMNPDSTPVTLFECHKFHKYTHGAYAIEAPYLCCPKWTREFYGRTWQEEQGRLQRAMRLDRDAALRSASWGKFQIMGFNHAACGFSNIQDFVNAMYKGERAQLMAFVGFVIHEGLASFLRRHDWAQFARRYNGPGYADNRYDAKLATAYIKALA